jgi:hypothetical protein
MIFDRGIVSDDNLKLLNKYDNFNYNLIDLAHLYFYYDFHDKSTGQAQLQRYELDDIPGRISI